MELLRSDDEVVYGDSGHIGTEKHPKIKENEHLASIDYCIVRRPRSLPRVSDSAIDWGRLIDHRKASISSLQRSIFIFATINLFSTTAIRPRIASPINQLSSFRLPLHFAVRTYVLFIVHQHQHFCKKKRRRICLLTEKDHTKRLKLWYAPVQGGGYHESNEEVGSV